MKWGGGLLGLLVLAACQPSTAHGADSNKQSVAGTGAGPSHPDCLEMPTTSTQRNCEASYEAEAAGALVEQEFQKLLKKMDDKDREWASNRAHTNSDEAPTYRQAAIGAQGAWRDFRTAQCQIEQYEWRGGASEAQRGSDCQQRMNRERLAQLEAMQKEF